MEENKVLRSEEAPKETISQEQIINTNANLD